MPPPEILANWALSDLDPEDIVKNTQDLIQNTMDSYNEIASLSEDQVSFDNCIKFMIDIDRKQATLESPLDFAQYCSKSKEVRDASFEACKLLSDANVELSMRRDIFDKVCAFKDQGDFSNLTAEQRRYVEAEIISGKRNGLHLSLDQRNKIKEVKKKISDLSSEFSFNINEDTSFEAFTRDELVGLPEDLIDTLEETEDGKLKLTMKYHHYFPVIHKCSNPLTRKRMEKTYHSRCLEVNTKILEELIVLRDQQAKLLGYESHAAYVLELRMARNPEKVAQFLSNLTQKLQPIWKKEREIMLKLKQKECKKYNLPFNGKLNFWDFRYYMTKVEELYYAVDQQKLKEYFPIQKVTKGLLQIYQELLSLKFIHISEKETWHEDVKLYRVDDTESNTTLGFFFLDLHPREGKFAHAAVFDLQPSCLALDGTRQVSVCAMMTNFAKPTATKPSLLSHGEVKIYFHEFGHVMHMICSRTETVKFEGTHVEKDFLEAPSQMLENWVWEEESLRKMSGHYKDNSEIPKELLDSLIKSKLANVAGLSLRQVVLSTFDQKIHTSSQADTQELFQNIYKDIMGIEPISGTNLPASWPHMVSYDAQYYGYLWSSVYSLDMFETRFKKEDLMNPKVGMDYRTKILQWGGTKDADDLLKDFLGRPANEKAFLKAKGLIE